MANGLQEMDSSGAAALSLITGMNHSERRDYALKRINELRLLIQHWENNEREKQVPKEKSLSWVW